MHESREEGELSDIGVDYGVFGRDREDALSILRVNCRNSSTGCLAATAVDRNGASDSASSYVTAFISILGLVRSDKINDQCLSLIERI